MTTPCHYSKVESSVIAVLLAVCPCQAKAGPGPELVWASGEVRLDAGLLELRRGARVQLLLPRDRALAAVGPVRLRLGSAVEVLAASGGALRLSGGGELRVGAWTVAAEAGSAVLLAGGRLYVVRGSAEATARAPGVPAAAPATAPPLPAGPEGAAPAPKSPVTPERAESSAGSPDAPPGGAAVRSHALSASTELPLSPLPEQATSPTPARCTAGAGQAIRMTLAVCVVEPAQAPVDAATALDDYGPPPTWTPSAVRVGDEDVEQAEAATRQRQQARREAASCGCTEPSGGLSGTGGNRRTSVAPEHTRGSLTVRVRGLPPWK